MKKVKFLSIAVLGILALSVASCKKCSECHYDTSSGEVELGEYCGDDLEEIEEHGYHDHNADTTYEVHCHEH